MAMPPALIALDWGTSSLRAFLVGGDGGVLDRYAAPLGILNVPEGDFESVYAAAVGPWLAMHPTLPALASGMIGSRQGWREAPYARCPAGLDELAVQLLPIERSGRDRLWIVPGVMRDAPGGPPDVMRGEETQILGSIHESRDTATRVFVLPGTHSKWALVEAGRIVWFATFMTGELYAVLKRHSILGKLMNGEEPDEAAFRRGLAQAGDDGSGLLHKLFTVRTLGLFDRLAATESAAYLSGLLIGSELREASAGIVPVLGTLPQEVTVIGESRLAELYEIALAARSIRARPAPDDAAVRGLWRLATAANLV